MGTEVDHRLLQEGAALVPEVNRDSVDFVGSMHAYLRPSLWEAPSGFPVTAEELKPLLHHGSKASALDELPRVVLAHLTDTGLGLVADMVRRSMEGEPSIWLNTAIHVPLKKKQPEWLLQNSRPVIFEACCRRIAATAVYRRLTHM
jgi:hypothetical protein